VKTALALPVLPSTTEASPTDSAGAGSSSVIVATPSLSEMLAFDAFDRSTRKVSSASSSVSPWTVNCTCFVGVFLVSVRVPLVAT